MNSQIKNFVDFLALAFVYGGECACVKSKKKNQHRTAIKEKFIFSSLPQTQFIKYSLLEKHSINKKGHS